MKYYVVYTSNGSFQVDKITEWDTLDKAKNSYWGICKTLGSSAEVKTGAVAILDSEFNVAGGYHEIINHEVAEAPAE